jgi:predicted transcriptional regulator
MNMPRPKSDIKREQSGVRLRPDLVKELKHLALDLEKPYNILIEEAIEDLLQKYKSRK